MEKGGRGRKKEGMEKKQEKQEERIGEALLKVALGYQIAEVTEEYAESDGQLKLVKRKKTKKDVPPDLKAVQMLLAEGTESEYGSWTDEELEGERKRLLAELAAAQEAEKTEVKTTVKSAAKSAKGTGRVATKAKTAAKTTKKTTKKSTTKTKKK